jgi:hypothetical protein
LLSGLSFTTQTQSPNTILNGVYKKMMKAKDYSVQATIKVDLPFIKMMPVEAQIYFKQKDKFRVVSKGIAIIPRQGFDQLNKNAQRYHLLYGGKFGKRNHRKFA